MAVGGLAGERDEQITALDLARIERDSFRGKLAVH
jgi:hypothetical protein